jgi:hypothetical protein
MTDIRLDRTVLIVDDHQSFSETRAISFESRPGISVVGVAKYPE